MMWRAVLNYFYSECDTDLQWMLNMLCAWVIQYMTLATGDSTRTPDMVSTEHWRWPWHPRSHFICSLDKYEALVHFFGTCVFCLPPETLLLGPWLHLEDSETWIVCDFCFLGFIWAFHLVRSDFSGRHLWSAWALYKYSICTIILGVCAMQ